MHMEHLPEIAAGQLVRAPLAPSARPPVLFLLHGYGSNAEDLFDLAPALPPEFLVVSLQAPLTLFPGQYAWFPLDWSSGTPIANPAHVSTARTLVREWIAAFLKDAAVDLERVFLLGFSQGAILSLAVAPLLTLKGVVALSGRFPHECAPEDSSLSGLRVFMGHGEADPVIPIDLARRARARLEQGECVLEYEEYAHGHGISPQEAMDVSAWLASTLRS